MGVNATSNDLEETVKDKLFPRDPERSMAFIRLKKREKLVSTNLKKYLVEIHARGTKPVIHEWSYQTKVVSKSYLNLKSIN